VRLPFASSGTGTLACVVFAMSNSPELLDMPAKPHSEESLCHPNPNPLRHRRTRNPSEGKIPADRPRRDSSGAGRGTLRDLGLCHVWEGSNSLRILREEASSDLQREKSPAFSVTSVALARTASTAIIRSRK
jgi:hypothetical protein